MLKTNQTVIPCLLFLSIMTGFAQPIEWSDSSDEFPRKQFPQLPSFLLKPLLKSNGLPNFKPTSNSQEVAGPLNFTYYQNNGYIQDQAQKPRKKEEIVIQTSNTVLDDKIQIIRLKKTLEEQTEEHKHALKSLKDQNEALAAQVKELKDEKSAVADLKAKVAILEEENQRAKFSVSKLGDQNSELKRQLTECQDSQKENLNLKGKFAALESDLEDKSDQIKKLSENALFFQKTISDLKTQADGSLAKYQQVLLKLKELITCSEKNALLLKENEELKAKTDATQAENQTIVAKVAGLQASLDKALAVPTQDCQKEQLYIAQLKNDIDTLKAKLATSESQGLVLIEKEKAFFSERKKLEARIAELQNVLSAGKLTEKALAECRAEVERLKALVATAADSAKKDFDACLLGKKKLSAENVSLEAKADELKKKNEDLQFNIKEAGKTIDDLQDQVQGLKKKVAELENALKNQASDSQTIADLKSRLNSTIDKLSETEEALRKTKNQSEASENSQLMAKTLKDLQTTYIECRKSLNMFMIEDRRRNKREPEVTGKDSGIIKYSVTPQVDDKGKDGILVGSNKQ